MRLKTVVTRLQHVWLQKGVNGIPYLLVVLEVAQNQKVVIVQSQLKIVSVPFDLFDDGTPLSAEKVNLLLWKFDFSWSTLDKHLQIWVHDDLTQQNKVGVFDMVFRNVDSL